MGVVLTFDNISMTIRRAVAWPLLWIGIILSQVARGFIVAGAWLTNQESVLRGLDD